MRQRIANSLRERFKTIVEGQSDMTFESTGVRMPDQSIWLSYADAMLDTLMEPTDEMMNAPPLTDPRAYGMGFPGPSRRELFQASIHAAKGVL